MEKHNKYSDSRIYMLKCNKTSLFYIGSTTHSLHHRLGVHVSDSKNPKKTKCRSNVIIDNGDYDIFLLENCTCESNDELRKIEASYQRLHLNDKNYVNCRIEDRTHDEWIIDNKDYHKKCLVDWYLQNKDRVKQRHRERAEEISKYQKEWNAKNKEKVRLYNLNYKRTHTEKTKLVQDKYRIKNKEKIKEYQKQRDEKLKKERKEAKELKNKLNGVCGLYFECPCGSNIIKYERNKHFKTKKHMKFLEESINNQ